MKKNPDKKTFILSAILGCPLPGISQGGQQLRLEGNKKDKLAGRLGWVIARSTHRHYHNNNWKKQKQQKQQ